jgi:hypothetical protein
MFNEPASGLTSFFFVTMEGEIRFRSFSTLTENFYRTKTCLHSSRSADNHRNLKSRSIKVKKMGNEGQGMKAHHLYHKLNFRVQTFHGTVCILDICVLFCGAYTYIGSFSPSVFTPMV